MPGRHGAAYNLHASSDDYNSGPAIRDTKRPTPTSGLTQRPVAGFAARRLYERSRDKEAAARRAFALLPKVDAWHC